MNAQVANPVFLALKAAGASALAVLACQALGISDLLSAAFVGVLAVSPTVVTGLKRAALQLLASAVAGVLAAGCTVLPVPVAAQVLCSVLACVGGAFLLRAGAAYPAAAFGALYVLLVPSDGTGHLLALRMASVLVGCASALVVNAGVSGMSYERVFLKRSARLSASAKRLLEGHAPDDGELFALEAQVRQVLLEMDDALSEGQWRPGVPAARLHEVHAGLSTLGDRLLQARAARRPFAAAHASVEGSKSPGRP